MKKEITRPCSANNDTGQAQRKLVTGVAINPFTGHLSISFEIQQLDLKGNPLQLQMQEVDTVNFHSNVVNTHEGLQGGDIPVYVSDYLSEIYALTETFLTAHEAAQTGGEDEA